MSNIVWSLENGWHDGPAQVFFVPETNKEIVENGNYPPDTEYRGSAFDDRGLGLRALQEAKDSFDKEIDDWNAFVAEITSQPPKKRIVNR